MMSKSPLQQLRLGYKPLLPELFQYLHRLEIQEKETQPSSSLIQENFPHTGLQPLIHFVEGEEKKAYPLKVGVVFSGGQAPGGHNVIAGLFDALKKMHPESVLIGFLDGPAGIISNQTKELSAEIVANFRNQGGFDMLGSGRTKIEKEEQFQAAASTAKALALNGIVIIGGDDSNTNAAFLAEYFKINNVPTSVVGVPKTIDGDLKNEWIEISFGFDTASKIYSETIGNIQTDAASAKKYYHFIKLMGRSASHITLECALNTHPNLALIGEEVAEQKMTLKEVVAQIVELVRKRAENGSNHGVILVPEGLIEFIADVKEMIQELNGLLASGQGIDRLSPASLSCFQTLTESIQKQLLLERDAHGNVQVSKIETERLLIDLVEKELASLKQEGKYKGKFNPQPQFCGYEGRSGLPSNFDANYCYALGFVSALLLQNRKSGYMACMKGLQNPVKDWIPIGVPIASLLIQERREGKLKIVIRKAMVDLNGFSFKKLSMLRKNWEDRDDYLSPGPIQFDGPPSIKDSLPCTLQG